MSLIEQPVVVLVLDDDDNSPHGDRGIMRLVTSPSSPPDEQQQQQDENNDIINNAASAAAINTSMTTPSSGGTTNTSCGGGDNASHSALSLAETTDYNATNSQDFTIPMSNKTKGEDLLTSQYPPLHYVEHMNPHPYHHHPQQQKPKENQQQRRAIFGASVQRRYAPHQQVSTSLRYHHHNNHNHNNNHNNFQSLLGGDNYTENDDGGGYGNGRSDNSYPHYYGADSMSPLPSPPVSSMWPRYRTKSSGGSSLSTSVEEEACPDNRNANYRSLSPPTRLLQEEEIPLKEDVLLLNDDEDATTPQRRNINNNNGYQQYIDDEKKDSYTPTTPASNNLFQTTVMTTPLSAISKIDGLQAPSSTTAEDNRIRNNRATAATTLFSTTYSSPFPGAAAASNNNTPMMPPGGNSNNNGVISPLGSPNISSSPRHKKRKKNIKNTKFGNNTNTNGKPSSSSSRSTSKRQRASSSLFRGPKRFGFGFGDCWSKQKKSDIPPSSSMSLTELINENNDRRQQQQHFQEENGGGADNTASSKTRSNRPHETIHAQSLLLGLVFAAIWTPSNMMAPNLTEMASDFGLNSAEQRDLYLGSYCALATGVFSFPLAAGIGILTDFHSRQRLFCWTAAGSAAAAIATGKCQTFVQLWFLRLATGGFMAASVPIAFSLLGDLFASEERNAASSGLTAMMGLGIVAGQVYAGMVGPSLGWEHPFYVSGAVTLLLALACLLLVQEPERGGKERVLQDMIQAGTRYDRKLTWETFCHAMQHNKSNMILLWQGFFSSLPWGIVFVFLNDYLSQERGFSVQDATFLVLLFGVACAVGGILGGYWGQIVQGWSRTYLPIFMAVTTLLGVAPFLGLLNTHFTNAHGFWGFFYSISAGVIASLPAVNVRPCLINVNPPETRGAALTAANLLINLGRGVGPSCVTLLVSTFQTDRQTAFNITLILFWVISAIQLALLAKTLPNDEDAMEEELASYALQALAGSCGVDGGGPDGTPTVEPRLSSTHPDDSFVSIEDRITSFDSTAMRETFMYVSEGIKELQLEMTSGHHTLPLPCNPCAELDSSADSSSAGGNSDDEGVVSYGGININDSPSPLPGEGLQQQQHIWRTPSPGHDSNANNENREDKDEMHPDETTPLVV